MAELAMQRRRYPKAGPAADVLEIWIESAKPERPFRPSVAKRAVHHEANDLRRAVHGNDKLVFPVRLEQPLVAIPKGRLPAIAHFETHALTVVRSQCVAATR